MRKKRRSNSLYKLDRRWLFGLIGLLIIITATSNCSFDAPLSGEQTAAGASDEQELSEAADETVEPVSADPFAGSEDLQTAVLDEQLWADVGEDITTPRAPHNSSERISINVKDANLLDVLSMLSYKIGVNIIFLEEPTQITLKTDTLSPVTTFKLILQKVGLDYLTIGDNYIVGNRDRLYGDFSDKMFLARYDLYYVSASDMEEYIEELGMPVESLSVDSNQRALWMQGTPMTLGKARELINTLDVIDNASFAEGGGRKIRMPVAIATGNRAEEELEALVDFLSILLDGFRDGRTDMGWVTWDHPDPLPSIYMDWESPIIKPYDIKMKITRDFASNYNDQIRYLVAEGTPDNIDLVNQMISTIAGTPSTPITFEVGDEDMGTGTSDAVEWIPDSQQQSASMLRYEVSLNGVPEAGGTLSGDGSFTEGSSVTITATTAEGYEFLRWIEGGSEISTSETYSFTIYGDRTFEAVFMSKSGEEASPDRPDEEGSEAAD